VWRLSFPKIISERSGDAARTEPNEGTTDPNEVEKVRHMIEAALDSIDDTPIFVDVISTKSFLASKKSD